MVSCGLKKKESKASELFVTFDVSGGLYESLAAVFLGFFCPHEVTQYNSMVQSFFVAPGGDFLIQRHGNFHGLA